MKLLVILFLIKFTKFMIYFLAIILNFAFLIVFAILTYFEFVLKGTNGFVKLFFILFEIIYSTLYFSTWKKKI